MVKQTVKSQLQQLQTASESALGKITQNQTARSALQSAAQLKDKGDKLLASLSSIEGRLSAIEKRLDAVEGKAKPKPATRTRSTASKPRTSAAAKPKTTAKPKP
jgi:predicted ribosome quality control (RQC) complex YloA/Tae2 family protein